MKLILGFSAWMIVAALLCLAPSALGQIAIHNKATGAASHVPRYAPSSVLVFTHALASNNHPRPVPEGGSALMYMLPAGLCCAGGIFLRFRWRVGVHPNN